MASYSKRKNDYSYSKNKDYHRRENGPASIQERQSLAIMGHPKSKKYTIAQIDPDITNIEYLFIFFINIYQYLLYEICYKRLKKHRYEPSIISVISDSEDEVDEVPKTLRKKDKELEQTG